MDPVSHLLFGRVVAQTVRRRTELRGMTAALVLGSIAPDIDAVMAFRGFEQYLRAHIAGTHALLGTVLGAVAVAAFLRLLLRDARWSVLFIAAWTGTLGHMLWDLAGGGDINALAPFSAHTFNWQLVAMGDPLIAVPLLLGALGLWALKRRGRPIAIGTLAVLALLLLGKFASQAAARRAYQEVVASHASPSAVAISPTFATLFDWTVYDRIDSRVRAWRVNSYRRTVDLLFERADAANGVDAELSRELPVVQTFFTFAKMPFARLENDGGERLVLWSDVRMCSTWGCDLSFGGAFDVAAMPLYQFVQIGTYRRNRPLPPNLAR